MMYTQMEIAEEKQRTYALAFKAWRDAFSCAEALRQERERSEERCQRESRLLDDVSKAWGVMPEAEQGRAELHVDLPLLQLGVYSHYKDPSARYTVLGFIWHHDVQRPMVKYVSHTYGKECARALRGWPGVDPDGWNEPVRVNDLWVPRFRLEVVHPRVPGV